MCPVPGAPGIVGVEDIKLKASGKYNGATILSAKGIASTLLVSTGRTRVTWSTPYPPGVTDYPVIGIQHAGINTNGYFLRVSAQTEDYVEFYSSFGNPFTFAAVNAPVSVYASEV